MITIKIEIPHQVVTVMSPKMIMGNYIDCDPRIQLLQQDKLKGLCSVEVKNEVAWDNEVSCILVNARYFSEEQELLTLLSL